MSVRTGRGAALACCLVVGACRERGPAAAQRESPRAAAQREAPREGAREGDPGEVCGEHGVLRSICSKCNPALAAVFQAKKDWCGDHGLPESVCPTCHPERGGRPAKAIAADDGSPADGTVVRLRGASTAERAGLRTARAAARPGAGGALATATVVYDAARVARVNARAAGVVRSLAVDLGSTVAAGAPLAVIESAEVGADRSRLEAARARVAIATEHLEREQSLVERQLTTRLEVLAAQRELHAARAEQASLAASLAVIGANQGVHGGAGRGAAATGRAGGSGAFTVTTPLGGVVVRRGASVGQLVRTDEVLFEVVDTSMMWAEIDVPERELGHTRAGQPVALRFDALPGRVFEATIGYVAPAIDPHTRTATARARLENADGVLRANLYGQARLRGEGRDGVAVPYQAVQRARSVHLVFVQQGEGQYEARRVELGPSDGDWVELVRGVKAGELVVTEGSFLLKTETLRDSIGAGCCAAD